MHDICIIGVGKLGGALAIAFADAGFAVRDLVVRDARIAFKIKRSILPDADISRLSDIKEIAPRVIFIAAGDPEIVEIASAIAPFITPRHCIFHTSGSLSSSILEVLDTRGAVTGSIHPLISISDPFSGTSQFREAYFCIEGCEKAVKRGKKLVHALGGKSFSIDGTAKALYHAAAVMAAGHVTALFDVATRMMTDAGPDRKTSKRIMLPLIQSTVSNLERQETSSALTGTFARLDIATFHRHLSSFRDLPPEYVRLYLDLGSHSLDLVEERDGQSERLLQLRKEISIAKRKFR